jgi:ABC-type molybdate transport system substrate-binding protein
LLSTIIPSAGFASDIKVISVGTVSLVLQDGIPQYERRSGNKVQINFGNPAVTLECLSKGNAADIVMVAGALWEQAEKTGRLKLRSRRFSRLHLTQ